MLEKDKNFRMKKDPDRARLQSKQLNLVGTERMLFRQVLLGLVEKMWKTPFLSTIVPYANASTQLFLQLWKWYPVKLLRSSIQKWVFLRRVWHRFASELPKTLGLFSFDQSPQNFELLHFLYPLKTALAESFPFRFSLFVLHACSIASANHRY